MVSFVGLCGLQIWSEFKVSIKLAPLEIYVLKTGDMFHIYFTRCEPLEPRQRGEETL